MKKILLYKRKLQDMRGEALKSKYYKIVQASVRDRIWNITDKVITFESTDLIPRDFSHFVELMQEFINELVDDYIEPLNDQDKVQITIKHPHFNGQIHLSLLEKDEITAEIIWTTLEQAIQSKKDLNGEDFNFKHKVTVFLRIVPVITGSGFSPTKFSKMKKQKIDSLPIKLSKSDCSNMHEYIKVLRSVITIKNTDNFCLIRAILVAIDKQKKEKKHLVKNYQNIKYKSLYNAFNENVIEVAHRCQIKNKACGINEITKLEKYFQEYRIAVIDPDFNTKRDCIYLNEEKKYSKFIYILYFENHYSAITSIKAYFKQAYFCNYCMVKYSGKSDHLCENLCFSCYRTLAECRSEKERKSFCNNLGCSNKMCWNEKCLEEHQKHLCSKRNECKICETYYQKGRIHICNNEKYCGNCKCVILNLYK